MRRWRSLSLERDLARSLNCKQQEDSPLSLAPPGASTQLSGKVIVASGAFMIPSRPAGPGAGIEDAKRKKKRKRKREKIKQVPRRRAFFFPLRRLRASEVERRRDFHPLLFFPRLRAAKLEKRCISLFSSLFALVSSLSLSLIFT